MSPKIFMCHEMSPWFLKHFCTHFSDLKIVIFDDIWLVGFFIFGDFGDIFFCIYCKNETS